MSYSHRVAPPHCNLAVTHHSNERVTPQSENSPTVISRYSDVIYPVKNGDISNVNASFIGISAISEASYNHTDASAGSITVMCARNNGAERSTIDALNLCGTYGGDRNPSSSPQGYDGDPEDARACEDRACDGFDDHRTDLNPEQAPIGDPFYRAVDRALEIEKVIRSRAMEVLQIAREEPWKIGGPMAQASAVEMARQHIFDSLERTAADIALLDEVTWIW